MNECLAIWPISPIGRGMRFKLAQVWVRIPNGLFDFLSNFCYNYYMKRRYEKWLEKDWGLFSKYLKGGLRKWVEVGNQPLGVATIKENQKRELQIIMLEIGLKETLTWYFRQEPIKKFIALGIFVIMVGYALGKIIGIIVKEVIKKW